MARKFKDLAGREWTLAVDLPAIRLVRDRLGINLTELVGRRAEVFTDLLVVCDMVYLVVKRQADELKVTQEDLESQMKGDQIEAAAEALVLAVSDHLPAAQGDAYRAAFALAKQADDMAFKLVMERLAGTTPAAFAEMAKATPA